MSQTTMCQVVSSVSFKANNQRKIIVQYLFSPAKDGQTYSVSLLASTNGGNSFIVTKSLSGDIGAVTTSGWKSITWDVLEDVDSFEGENCIVKVVAEEVHTTSELVSNFLFGDDQLKEKSNGTTWGIGWTKTIFPNASTIEAKGGVDISARYSAIPLIVDVEGFFQSYSFPQDYIQGYSELSFDGMNISVRYINIPNCSNNYSKCRIGVSSLCFNFGNNQ